MYNITLFNVWHILILCFTAALPVAMYFICRRKSQKFKFNFMLCFAIVNLMLYVFRILRLSGASWFNIWDELPLHLCNFGLFVNIIALLTNSRTLQSFAYCYGSIGALFAVLVPTVHFMNSPIYDIGNISFYLQHAMIFGFGISLRSLGFVRFTVKDACKCTAFLAAFALFAHGVNLLLTTLNLGNPNYMFTMDASINPLLDIVYKLVPVPFVYLLVLLPVVALVAFIMYIPTLIGNKKRAKAQKSA